MAVEDTRSFEYDLMHDDDQMSPTTDSMCGGDHCALVEPASKRARTSEHRISGVYHKLNSNTGWVKDPELLTEARLLLDIVSSTYVLKERKMWKAFTDSQRSPYEKKAKEQKETYDKFYRRTETDKDKEEGKFSGKRRRRSWTRGATGISVAVEDTRSFEYDLVERGDIAVARRCQ